jgi:mycothiol synthase
LSLSIEPCYLPDPVCDVLARSMTAESIDAKRFTRQVLLDPNFLAEGSLLAKVDGKPAGYLLALARQVPLENAKPDPERGYITLYGVLPEFRRAGVGGALLTQGEAFLRNQGRSQIWISPYAPGYFIPGVDVNAYSEGLSFLASRGYKEVYRPLAMQAPLWSLSVPEWVSARTEELAHASPPVRCVPFNRGLTAPLLAFAREHFPGDWVRVVRETMGAILGGQNPNRLIIALQPVAHQTVRVLGFSHYENERFGPIGVDAAERGRGIGQVLMYETLQAQCEAGFRSAWFLWSDDKTAERLYNAAGFREVRRFALLRKELG